METPQTEANIPQEQEKKRSPWLVVLLILLILMMGCCILGAILCRGTSRLPDLLDRIITEIPGNETGDNDFWGLVDDLINNPEGFFPDGDFPELEEFFPDGDFPEMEEFFPEDPSGGSICNGLSGNLEMQVRVGPAEVVGLEPLGIGSIPLSVEPAAGAYQVTGYGTIDFQDQLDTDWGFYVVTFDSTANLSGTCIGDEESGELNVVVHTEGEQLIQVFVGADEWSYPWSGEYEFVLEFPIEDGAEVSGEGWAFVLHLD
ncbi:MAG: hypothetical protein J7L35_00490 [Anaerolineales bacterium]|nr:hypothetical protein [Anaerolineales bacterium]